MKKDPTIRLVATDLLRDLAPHDNQVFGAWTRIFLNMYFQEPRGEITLSVDGWSRLLGEKREETFRLLGYIGKYRIGDVTFDHGKCDSLGDPCNAACNANVTHLKSLKNKEDSVLVTPDVTQMYAPCNASCNADVTVVCRRMRRKSKDRESSRLRVEKFREKRSKELHCNADVTLCARARKNNLLHKPNSRRITNQPKEGEKKRLAQEGEGGKKGTGACPPCPHEKILAIYLEILPELPGVRKWDGPAKEALAVRWREDKDRQCLSWWRAFFEEIRGAPWLMGRKGNWRAALSWIVRRKNFYKILDGEYTSGRVPDLPSRTGRNLRTAMQWASRGGSDHETK